MRIVCVDLNTTLTPTVAERLIPLRVPSDVPTLQRAADVIFELESQRTVPSAALARFDNTDTFRFDTDTHFSVGCFAQRPDARVAAHRKTYADILVALGTHYITGDYCYLRVPMVIVGERDELRENACFVRGGGFYVGTGYGDHSPSDAPIVLVDLWIEGASRCGVFVDGEFPLSLIRCQIYQCAKHGLAAGACGWVNVVNCQFVNNGCVYTTGAGGCANEFSTILLRGSKTSICWRDHTRVKTGFGLKVQGHGAIRVVTPPLSLFRADPRSQNVETRDWAIPVVGRFSSKRRMARGGVGCKGSITIED